MIFSFHLFSRSGEQIYHQQWKRLAQSSHHNIEDDAKLMFGMLFSLKAFVGKLSPHSDEAQFHHYTTGSYKLNYMETLSGLKFVMLTDNKTVGNIANELKEIYAKFYVKYVSKNPTYNLGDPITSEIFREKLDQYVRSLPFFRL